MSSEGPGSVGFVYSLVAYILVRNFAEKPFVSVAFLFLVFFSVLNHVTYSLAVIC
jgi:hypothetical protein